MMQQKPEDLIDFGEGVSAKDLTSDQKEFLLEVTRLLGNLEEAGVFARVAVTVSKEKLYPDRPVDEPKRLAFSFLAYPDGKDHGIDHLEVKPAILNDNGKTVTNKLQINVVRKKRKPFEKDNKQQEIKT